MAKEGETLVGPETESGGRNLPAINDLGSQGRTPPSRGLSTPTGRVALWRIIPKILGKSDLGSVFYGDCILPFTSIFSITLVLLLNTVGHRSYGASYIICQPILNVAAVARRRRPPSSRNSDSI